MNYKYLILLLLTFSLLSCNVAKKVDTVRKPFVVTTLFPLYDFAKNIGKDKVNVELLLPAGIDAHSFEPKPEDIVKINKTSIFIFTGENMEPWVKKILKSIDNKNLIVVDASKNIKELIIHEDHEKNGHRHDDKIDPHIWLDFEKAKVMVDNILEGFILADKQNEEFYIRNADILKEKLNKIDRDYQNLLSNCKNRYLFHAGHFAFGYLAKRYNLKYFSAYPGLSSNEEPSPVKIAKMIGDIKKYNVKYVFYEELISPRIANVLSKEAGVAPLKINPAHNVSKDDLERGITFFDIMEYNLKQLKIGLECQ